ncbi:MAG: META domain-containing protein [Acidimicrobiales bacterium]|jgi:heat shock protein HslJ|nr:META domain-containing protein [Acidimicrobiales bacterium]
MRLRLLCILAALGALTLAGCGDDETTDAGGSPGSTAGGSPGTADAGSDRSADAGLTGSSWVLASYQDAQGAAVEAVGGEAATLSFGDEGSLNGNTGCNVFAGGYTVDGETLTITLGPTTLRGCEDPALQAQETALTQNLPKTAGYTIEGESLALTAEDGTTLFTYTAGLSGLVGTSWQVTGVNNGREAVESTALTEALTAEFGDDGTFSGAGGCNQLGGPFTTTGTDGIQIGPLQTTMMACDPDVEQLEAQYSAALQAATTYQIDGNVLTLRDADGATQVTATLAG